MVYSETVFGYQRKRLQDHEVIDFQTLDLPTVEFRTRALWYEMDRVIGREPFPRGTRCSAPCTRWSTARSPCSR